MTFEQILMKAAAPAICGIKPGNLFLIKKGDFSGADFFEWKKLLAQNGLSSFFMPLEKDALCVFVYNDGWTKEILNGKKAAEYLLKKGYGKNLSAAAFLDALSFRMKNKNNFPHEVGILLGYPVGDVAAFEKNNGRGFKFCGAWKAYSNVSWAKECFFEYKNCSALCQKWFSLGYSLEEIIKKYNKAKKAA